MYIYLSKILLFFVTPIGIVSVFMLIAVLLLWLHKRKPALTFLMAALAVFWVFSMPIVADSLLGKLERSYPPVAMNDVPRRQCVIVLGGALEPVLAPRLDADLKEAADRVYLTARLFTEGKADKVVVTGGNKPWSSSAQSEAKAIQKLLTEWGVPESVIILEEASRNTRENVVNTWSILQSINCLSPLLVTSAAHMRRSVAGFAMVGIEVFPVSADIRVVDEPRLTIFDFLPNVVALKKSTDAMHEWIGQIYYQLRGWS